MLEMISLTDRAKVVLTSDTAIKATKKEREEPKVLFLENATVEEDEKPTVFTVRLLNTRERMQMAEAASLSNTQALFTASERAICKIEGPGLNASKKDAISDALLRLPPSVVYTIAGWVMERSSLKNDPLDVKK